MFTTRSSVDINIKDFSFNYLELSMRSKNTGEIGLVHTTNKKLTNRAKEIRKVKKSRIV